MAAYSTPFVGKFVGNKVICLNTLYVTDAYVRVWQRVNPPYFLIADVDNTFSTYSVFKNIVSIRIFNS